MIYICSLLKIFCVNNNSYFISNCFILSHYYYLQQICHFPCNSDLSKPFLILYFTSKQTLNLQNPSTVKFQSFSTLSLSKLCPLSKIPSILALLSVLNRSGYILTKLTEYLMFVFMHINTYKKREFKHNYLFK